MTFGEKAVGLSFNPSGDPEVHEAKATIAKAIDQMNAFRNMRDPGDASRHASVAITQLEDAQMRMVKALTWKD
jgi:hypothetical protein